MILGPQLAAPRVYRTTDAGPLITTTTVPPVRLAPVAPFALQSTWPLISQPQHTTCQTDGRYIFCAGVRTGVTQRNISTFPPGHQAAGQDEILLSVALARALLEARQQVLRHVQMALLANTRSSTCV